MPISSRNKSLIQEGMANRKIVRIRYKKEDKEFKKPKPTGRTERGDIVVRNLEPYEIDDNYFWGYDVTLAVSNNDRIKRFKLDNIRSVTVINRNFSPRTFS
tara:strand:- start:847 stop:1149 length:303 start_codon:yes stop_codon:yes gene_type:complete